MIQHRAPRHVAVSSHLASQITRHTARSVCLTAIAAAALPAAWAAAQCLEECTVIHTFVGESPGDQFGWVSNDVGDLDGDGVRDLVLTAPTHDGGGNASGRIYVYSGASADLLFTATGAAANWTLGHDAGTAGDLDGDGVPDVIASAPIGGTGRVIVYSGASRGVGVEVHTFEGQANGEEFGHRVAGGGDFNGDGIADVIIGAPGSDGNGVNAGRAYVYSGADFSLLCTLNGPSSNDRFGSGVAFVGDLDGDGRDEIACGAQDASTGGGLVFVYRWTGTACQALFLLNPGTPSLDFGLWFMNGGGDVNGDGTPDIYANDYQLNRAHVFSGANGAKIWTLTGDAIGQFGIGRMIDDVDGDGCADLVLAAWVQGTGAPNAGKAFVYSGKTAAVLETFTHDVAGAGFGFDANGMGDVNGDGRFDYLITAALDNANGSTGVAYLVAGTVSPRSVPGDLDGDGHVDGADLGILLSQWGAAGSADLDGSGTVDGADLGALLAAWAPEGVL